MRFFVLPLVLLMSMGVAVLARQEEDVPRAPTNLKATGEYKGAMAVANLSWHDESENETGFEILRSGNSGEYRVIAFVGANTTRYRDEIGKYVTGAFAYKVRAFRKNVKSEESNVASVWF